MPDFHVKWQGTGFGKTKGIFGEKNGVVIRTLGFAMSYGFVCGVLNGGESSVLILGESLRHPCTPLEM